jgi:hypothetical protein
MRHNREEVIERATQEFELLDHLVANLTSEDWNLLLPRPETKDPWTVKDALAHITYWKANTARSVRRQKRPAEERGLTTNETNHLLYLRWHDRSPQEVLAWHRQVQDDLIAALRAAPDEWFSSRERDPQWPFDVVGHSDWHRVKDIEYTLMRSSHL